MLALVNQIAKSGRASVILAFQGVFGMPPDDLLGKLCGVIFRHALQHGFQDNALRPIGDILPGGQDLHAVLFQLGLVVGAVVAVTGKTVQLPDNDQIKEALRAVLHHALKLRAVRGPGGQGPVNVGPHNRKVVFLAVVGTLPNLALDALLPLAVAGIPGINYCFHASFPSLNIRNSASFSLPFTGDFGSKHISMKSRISSFCAARSIRAWGL